MRCCQNKTSFSWSKSDIKEGERKIHTLEIGGQCYINEGERKIHTIEIGGHVQMAKSDPGAQRKSSLSDCTWLEK
jgi:hypothetical protein